MFAWDSSAQLLNLISGSIKHQQSPILAWVWRLCLVYVLHVSYPSWQSISAKALQKVIWRLCAHEIQKLLEENEEVSCLVNFQCFLLREISIYYQHILALTRLGEWGDHVTLQAAADRVSWKFLFCPQLAFEAYIRYTC